MTSMTVNGEAIRYRLDPETPLLFALRDASNLTGAKHGCYSGDCGTCTVMVDGQGIAHPRGMGIASHLGLFLEVPCIGCAKSLLYGHYQEPETEAGSISPLKDKKEKIIGQVVRTKNKVKPVYVSPGHRIDMASSVRLTLDMCRGYRLPESTRQAHLLVNQFRREHGEKI